MPNPEATERTEVRDLILILGDQLHLDSPVFDGFDPKLDRVLMIEAREEASYIPQHKKRLVFFFSAMRHFRDRLEREGRKVEYVSLLDPSNRATIIGELARQTAKLKPARVIVLEPGDYRVRASLAGLGLPLLIVKDNSFLCSEATFRHFADGKRHLVLEHFYRFMRRRLNVLIDKSGNPTGGQWNYDRQNRQPLKQADLFEIPRLTFSPDAITQEVITLVANEFPNSPGKLDRFDLPVDRQSALSAMAHFVEQKLPMFGTYQDAILSDQPFLYHSLLSGPLNLHLLHPREVINAALENPSGAPMNSVEGFVRQVMGWREFVRGVYWRFMPEYEAMNVLSANLSMPRIYWTGETDMQCLSQAIENTIEYAYAHHIERLMVLGLFALLLGVRPYEVHKWHMSMFWDAIDWVSLPNTLGMSQYGDGGTVGTKPYVASGNYIDRMSDHCANCRYDPRQSTGPNACPFTTLYWDFLSRNESHFSENSRMKHQYANLNRKTASELRMIRKHADTLKEAHA